MFLKLSSKQALKAKMSIINHSKTKLVLRFYFINISVSDTI